MNFKEHNKQEKIATFIDLENVNRLESIPYIFSYLKQNNFIATPRKLIVSKINQEEKLTQLIKECYLEIVISYKRIKKGKTKRAKDSNKNNADFRYYIEVLETLYTRDDINAFCIVTSDEDYTELILKLKSEGKFILGVGNKDVTSEKFIALFDQFIFVDDLVSANENVNKIEAKQEDVPSKKEEIKEQIEIKENKKNSSSKKANEAKKPKVKETKTKNTKIKKEKDSSKKVVNVEKEEAKKSTKKEQLEEFKSLASNKINSLKPGKYNLSNITSEIKSQYPKRFSIRFPVEEYVKLGYQIHIDNDDKSNAYIIVEEKAD